MSRANLAQPAIRTGHKARIALSGPTGSGKSFSGLIIARELAGPEGTICVIDTERGSASLYSDQFEFDTIDWKPPYDPRELAEDIKVLSQKYDVVMCDSITHYWQGEGGTLDIVDASAARAGGNSYAGWKTGTPAQNSLVEAMLQADSHIICTMRSKMEHVLEKDPKTGKSFPKKVGMSPIQRDGIEYEFTIGGELNIDHELLITKSRFSDVADRMYPSHQIKDMAAAVKGWLDTASTDLSRFLLETLKTAEERAELKKAWLDEKTGFDFRTNAVPVDREQNARDLIASFATKKSEVQPKEEWGGDITTDDALHRIEVLFAKADPLSETLTDEANDILHESGYAEHESINEEEWSVLKLMAEARIKQLQDKPAVSA
jgi:hypothetical protein